MYIISVFLGGRVGEFKGVIRVKGTLSMYFFSLEGRIWNCGIGYWVLGFVCFFSEGYICWRSLKMFDFYIFSRVSKFRLEVLEFFAFLKLLM